MAYREVTMIETKEVLRQWLAGVPKKRIASLLGTDPKTVRRYVKAAKTLGLVAGQSVEALTDDLLGKVAVAVRGGVNDREHGAAWARCEEQKEFIEKGLANKVRLSKIRRLLQRHGVQVPYSTLYRFAVEELDFGRSAATVPVIDGDPGQELQVDTGWVLQLLPDENGHRRRLKAWIFTPVVSRYRFVYPCLKETTASAIEACEAAWEFYGGIFRVLIPDNTKAIIHQADPLDPKIVLGFLEYAQARGFHVDPTRVRHAKDKARVERSVRDVRDDCFGGEHLGTIEDARLRAVFWCQSEYGMRRHSSTWRMPREHFDSDEKPRLLPAPAALYDIPKWSDPKVGRDHFAQVDCALYTLPTELIGKRLRARSDKYLVRFYFKGVLVKTHSRVERGHKSIDPMDFPAEKTPYAMRDIDYLEAQAYLHGNAVGKYAHQLLAGPLPWTKMRRVRALLRLAEKFGDERVSQVCQLALQADMIDVRRLERMLQLPPPTDPEPPPAKIIPLGRYLRPPRQYALPFASKSKDIDKEPS